MARDTPSPSDPNTSSTLSEGLSFSDSSATSFEGAEGDVD